MWQQKNTSEMLSPKGRWIADLEEGWNTSIYQVVFLDDLSDFEKKDKDGSWSRCGFSSFVFNGLWTRPGHRGVNSWRPVAWRWPKPTAFAQWWQREREREREKELFLNTCGETPQNAHKGNMMMWCAPHFLCKTTLTAINTWNERTTKASPARRERVCFPLWKWNRPTPDKEAKHFSLFIFCWTPTELEAQKRLAPLVWQRQTLLPYACRQVVSTKTRFSIVLNKKQYQNLNLLENSQKRPDPEEKGRSPTNPGVRSHPGDFPLHSARP